MAYTAADPSVTQTASTSAKYANSSVFVRRRPLTEPATLQARAAKKSQRLKGLVLS